MNYKNNYYDNKWFLVNKTVKCTNGLFILLYFIVILAATHLDSRGYALEGQRKLEKKAYNPSKTSNQK